MHPSDTSRKTPYPTPGPMGGRLIRKVISDLKAHAGEHVQLPLVAGKQKVFLAVSGGLDSTALFLLIAKYGRRIAPADSLKVLHVNHGWRAEASDEDERFVRSLAEEFQIPLEVLRAEPPTARSSRSWEDHARDIRRSFFCEQVDKNPGSWVMTAHQADDQVETLLWRLFTGTTDTHGEGILRVHSEIRVLRSLLGIRRKELQLFLEEEGRTWRKDQTNFESRFLRARLRQELLPQLESIFPKAIDRLLTLSSDKGRGVDDSASGRKKTARASDFVNLFWGAAGLSLRRPHVKHMIDALASGEATHVSLPGGWTFRKDSSVGMERWVLERAKRSPSVQSVDGDGK